MYSTFCKVVNPTLFSTLSFDDLVAADDKSGIDASLKLVFEQCREILDRAFKKPHQQLRKQKFVFSTLIPYADSACRGANHLDLIRNFGLISCVNKKDHKKHSLTDFRKYGNKQKSKTRARGHCLLTMFCYNLCRQHTLLNY
ncbi:hypothetical protein [Sutterella megalosphaeroides]|uniref:Uncharacterized protein n=1 Tax=Sutterella megalosphaeroides TaxID=2494234 RepID=A0A2Z6IAK3_9BURK|nr:hypothetical protein [Sutterella megalosphaeroides]BBF22930.1 hypothetical protein SUTMEG_08210 [Sutterella megalosphaeroides]